MQGILETHDAQESLPQHHHVNVSAELKRDLRMWVKLLQDRESGTPFLHTMTETSEDLDFFTDAASSPELGWGSIFGTSWMYAQWPEGFLEKVPLIAFLELYALVLAVATWADRLLQRRVTVQCNNMSDALSRLQVKLFKKLNPHASQNASQPVSYLYPPSRDIWNRW